MLMLMGSLLAQALWAQQGPPFNTTVPSQIMEQFRNERIQWTTNVWVYANELFGILAIIEFAWSAAVMLLEKTDLQTWTSALIRKLMWIGAFYALLLNGRIWIPAIIDSFTQIGQNAAGLGALSPSGVFVQGLSIAGALMDGASTSAFFTNPGTSFALAFAAILIVVSYTVISINFIVTMVESYLIVSVGFIFLGFGGSRWTAPYTERYIGLAVSIGIKIVLLYCLISAGFGLGLSWLDEAQTIGTSTRPAMTAFDVMGGSLIFMMCCWQIPKLFSAVLGGSPALTGGDLVATAAVVGGAALAVGGAAVAGVGALAGGGGAAAGTGSAASAGGSGSSTTTAVANVGSAGPSSVAGGSTVPPPTPGSAPGANGGGLHKQPDPPTSASSGISASAGPPIATPGRDGSSAGSEDLSSGLSRKTSLPAQSISSALSSIGGEPLAGSGFETQPNQKGFVPVSVNAAEGGRNKPATVPPSSSNVGTMPSGEGAISADEGSGPNGLSDQGTSAVSDIASVGSAGSADPQPPARTRGRSVFGRASDQVRGLRRRLGAIPSDAAPHAMPPKIPIEHEE